MARDRPFSCKGISLRKHSGSWCPHAIALIRWNRAFIHSAAHARGKCHAPILIQGRPMRATPSRRDPDQDAAVRLRMRIHEEPHSIRI